MGLPISIVFSLAGLFLQWYVVPFDSSLGIVVWLALFSLLSVPFDTLVLVVSLWFALGLVLLVSYFSVSYPLRLFAASQSLQVNDYSFLCFTSWVYRPISHFIFATLWNLWLGGKLFVFLLVYFGCCLHVWDHSWCVISCKSGVYSGVVLTFSLVVGVDDVCVLFSCLFSSFSVAVSNIFVSCSNISVVSRQRC